MSTWNPKDDPEFVIQSPEEILDRGRKRGKRFWYISSFLTILVLGLFAYSLINNLNQSHSNTTQVTQIKNARSDSRVALCNLLDAQATQINNQTDTINQILVASTKASRPLEASYQRFGFPPYADRLAATIRITQQLNAHKVAILDCNVYVKTGRAVATPNSPVKSIPTVSTASPAPTK